MSTLEALADVEAAATLLREDPRTGGGNILKNPSDVRYIKLCTKITPVKQNSSEWNIVFEAMNSTIAESCGFTLNLRAVFRIERNGEEERFKQQHLQDSNKRLLWHGSRISNMVGILKNGLRIAPPEAPVSGYMFGKGIYLANMSSKAAEFTHATPENPTGVILLCEAAIGKSLELTHGKYLELSDLTSQGLQSTKGIGRFEPSIDGVIQLENNQNHNDQGIVSDGSVISIGPERKQSTVNGDIELEHDEFIVYEESRIVVRYALEIDFNFVSGWKPRDLTYTTTK